MLSRGKLTLSWPRYFKIWIYSFAAVIFALVAYRIDLIGEQRGLDHRLYLLPMWVSAITSVFYVYLVISNQNSNSTCSIFECVMRRADFDGNLIDGSRYFEWMATTGIWMLLLCIIADLTVVQLMVIVTVRCVTCFCYLLAAYQGKGKRKCLLFTIAFTMQCIELFLWFGAKWFDADFDVLTDMQSLTGSIYSLYPFAFLVFQVKASFRIAEDVNNVVVRAEPGPVEAFTYAVLDLWCKAYVPLRFVQWEDLDTLPLGDLGTNDQVKCVIFLIIVMYIGSCIVTCCKKTKKPDVEESLTSDSSSKLGAIFDEDSAVYEERKKVSRFMPCKCQCHMGKFALCMLVFFMSVVLIILNDIGDIGILGLADQGEGSGETSMGGAWAKIPEFWGKFITDWLKHITSDENGMEGLGMKFQMPAFQMPR